jgi:hypothetical protein
LEGGERMAKTKTAAQKAADTRKQKAARLSAIAHKAVATRRANQAAAKRSAAAKKAVKTRSKRAR